MKESRLLFGHGYLGSRVAALWLAEGHRVFATTRSRDRANDWRARGIEPIVADVLDPKSLRDLPAVDGVLYCIGFDHAAGRTMREVYVAGLANVLQSLPTPRRFLYVSSTSVYGQTDGTLVDESAPTMPLEENGRVVLDAEACLRDRIPEAIVLRFAGIYGPGRWLKRTALMAGEPLDGDPEAWLNLIHVEDGAAAVLAGERWAQPGRVYNICDDHPVRRGDWYGRMAELLGAPPPTFTGRHAEAGGRRGSANRRIDNRRMRDELHVQLQYPSFEEGLRASL